MSKAKKILNISDKIEVIYVQYNRFKSNLVNYLVDWDVKRGDLFHADETKFILRDSIFYRFEGVLFHLDLMLKEHNHIKLDISQNFPKAGMNHHESILKSKERIHFLFDDIVFNIISFFDYTANLIAFLYIGKHSIKKNWNKIARAMMDDNNSLSKTKLSKVIALNHKTWITQLYDYRSDIIHKRRDTAGGSTKIDIDIKNKKLHVDFIVEAPKTLVKKVKIIKIELQPGFNIIDVSIWLIGKAINTAFELLKIIMIEKQ